jgi:predicted DNA-binding transcriptional regulator AlpA
MERTENPLAPPSRRAVKPITENTRFLSVSQMAERYSVHVDTVWRWVGDGYIPKPVKINPQVTRWRLDEVEARDAEREAARDHRAA